MVRICCFASCIVSYRQILISIYPRYLFRKASLLHLPTAPRSAIDDINSRLTDVLDFTESDEPWQITCRSYRDQVDVRLRKDAESSTATTITTDPATYIPKVQYLLTFGHARDKMYSMIATMGARLRRQQQQDVSKGETGIVVEVDRQFEGILGKLKNLWTKRQEITIEVSAG